MKPHSNGSNHMLAILTITNNRRQRRHKRHQTAQQISQRALEDAAAILRNGKCIEIVPLLADLLAESLKSRGRAFIVGGMSKQWRCFPGIIETVAGVAEGEGPARAFSGCGGDEGGSSELDVLWLVGS